MNSRKGSWPRMTGTEILNIPSGFCCAWVSTRSASCRRISGSWHLLKYSRPCADRVTRRVVRLSSDTPSSDSSTDNRRLTVEIGIPSERAARVMLSNWATLTNIRMLSRSAIDALCHLWKADCRDYHLINLDGRPDNSFQQRNRHGPKAADLNDYEAKDRRCDWSIPGYWRGDCQPVFGSWLQRSGQLTQYQSQVRAAALRESCPGGW